MRLIDSHAHLQADRFVDDAEEVLAAARESGVERLMLPGWDLASTRASLAFAARTGVDASAGIHPHHATDSTDPGVWAAIVGLALDPLVRAIGETGLDYDRDFTPRQAQLDSLRRHFDLALEVGKPVIIHCRSAPRERDAQDDLLRELAAAGIDGGAFRDSASGETYPLRVSDAERLEDSFVGADVSYAGSDDPAKNNILEVFKRCWQVRSLGSAGIRGAWLAAGYLDVSIGTRNTAWDYAPTALLVSEAGGSVTNLTGGPWTYDADGLIATNNDRLQAEVLEIIAGT